MSWCPLLFKKKYSFVLLLLFCGITEQSARYSEKEHERSTEEDTTINGKLITINFYWIAPILSKDSKSSRVDKGTWQIESVSCNIKLVQNCMKDRNHLHVFQRNISDLVDLSCSQFDIYVGTFACYLRFVCNFSSSLFWVDLFYSVYNSNVFL